MALFQPQDTYCPRLGLQVPWIGGAARIDDPDIVITLDIFDMGMSTHNDVGMAAKVVLQGLEELSERQPWRFRDNPTVLDIQCQRSAGVGSSWCVPQDYHLGVQPPRR